MLKTHLLFALFLSLILHPYFDFKIIPFILILVLSATLPDIDHCKSWIGKKVFPLSYIINFIFGHRKLIHSLFFVLVLSLLINLLYGDYYIPFLIGYLSHLFLDSLTRQGINLFYPLKPKANGFIKTNGVIENMFLGFLLIINLLYFLKYIF